MEDRQVLMADEMRCPSCGAPIKRAAEICVHCGVRVPRRGGQASAEGPTPKPVVGGILGVVAGVAPLIAGSVLVALGAIVSKAWGWVDWLPIGIGIGLLVLGLVAVIGSSCAIVRKNFGMAIAGGVCAMFSFWLLGIPALVLIALSSREFNHFEAR